MLNLLIKYIISNLTIEVIWGSPMFKRKEKYQELVGASAKLAAAERMKNSKRMDSHDDSKNQAFSQAIPATVVFVFCAALVVISSEGSFFNVGGWHPTGISNLDNLLVGSTPPHLVGDGDINRLLVILVRSFALFILSGIIPFMGLMATRMTGRGRLNPLVACWGAIIVLPLLSYVVQEVILPMF